MTTNEVLSEIRKLSIPEQRAVIAKLNFELREIEIDEKPSDAELERREREFEREMFADGLFSSIPKAQMSDEEFDDFEPLIVEGESLSEQVIRERI